MQWQPGELDQRIDIYRESLADDGIGGQDVSLSVLHSGLWAKAKPLSGNESQRFDKLNATAMVKFVIRYVDGILPDDRIKWGSDWYNVRHILPVSGRSLYLEIDAEKGVAL